jgi:hypothetical protein
MKKLLQSLVLGTGVAYFISVPGQAAVGVFVRVAPPRPVVEYVVPAPAPRMVWASGFYQWNRRAYAWAPGYWAYPPVPAAIWVAPKWMYQPSRGGYVFVAGYWRY